MAASPAASAAVATSRPIAPSTSSASGATKPQIKDAVEKLFDVKVKSVNTLIRKGKVRIFKGRPGELQNTKRAVVTLEEGHRIDVTTGL